VVKRGRKKGRVETRIKERKIKRIKNKKSKGKALFKLLSHKLVFAC
jgi:hypothetical protein